MPTEQYYYHKKSCRGNPLPELSVGIRIRAEAPALYPELPGRKDDVEVAWTNHLFDAVTAMTAAHMPHVDWAAVSPSVIDAIMWYATLHTKHGTWKSRTPQMLWRNIVVARRWKALGGDPYGISTAGVGGSRVAGEDEDFPHLATGGPRVAGGGGEGGDAGGSRVAGESGGGPRVAAAATQYPDRLPPDSTCPDVGCTLDELVNEPCLKAGAARSPVRDFNPRHAVVYLVGDSGLGIYGESSKRGIKSQIHEVDEWTQFFTSKAEGTYGDWVKELREFRKANAPALVECTDGFYRFPSMWTLIISDNLNCLLNAACNFVGIQPDILASFEEFLRECRFWQRVLAKSG